MVSRIHHLGLNGVLEEIYLNDKFNFLIDYTAIQVVYSPEYMSLNNLFPVTKFTDIMLSIILSCCHFHYL